MPEQYERLDEKPYDSHYLHAEVILDHPVERVWPHALKIGRWMSAHGLETVAGESGKVGHFERVYPRGLGPEIGLPHHHVYGIAHIIPHKYLALEVLPERGGSYGNKREWISFDGILLTDLGAKTQLTFLLIDVHRGKGSREEYAQRGAEIEGLRKLLDQYFENLRCLVAASGV
jgi:hypothetical protein